MVAIHTNPDTRQKLEILSSDAQYDLACACGTSDTNRRIRGQGDRWIYPVTLPNGGQSVLFRTLISNVCANDCKYCPLRSNQDLRRCVMEPEETVNAFMEYYRARKVFGLFLSSGVTVTPDRTMDRVYFSAYQRGLGDASLPGESSVSPDEQILTREHRLYQVDWLLRKYGFQAAEIPFTESGNLSATLDPKEHWASQHPERFPVDINRADRLELLRVPGLGPALVDRILQYRTQHGAIQSLDRVAKPNKRLQKASSFLKF